MDQHDPAWKLAAAAEAAAISGDMEAFEKAFKELKPSARNIARAYAISLTTPPLSAREASRLILDRRLQVALMEEHVAAQRRMGRTINVLTGVLVALTLALVIFGGIEIAPKVRAWLAPPLSEPGGAPGRMF